MCMSVYRIQLLLWFCTLDLNKMSSYKTEAPHFYAHICSATGNAHIMFLPQAMIETVRADAVP